MGKGARNDFKSSSNCAESILLGSLYASSVLLDRKGKGHFSGTSTRAKTRIVHDVTGDAHGIAKVALNLVEDILCGTTQENGASLWISALFEESKVPEQKK
jgi:hypothetical protein